MDFTFLSIPAVVLCSTISASLTVIHWDPQAPKLLKCVRFRLPSLLVENQFSRIQCHSNPCPSNINYSTSKRPFKDPYFFPPSPEHRILAFSCTVWLPVENNPDPDRFFMLFVSRTELEEKFGEIDFNPQVDPLFVPKCDIQWDQWGPYIARWIPKARPYGWAVCSKGFRFVCSHPDDHVDSCRVMMIDFNPNTVMRSRDTLLAAGGEDENLHSESEEKTILVLDSPTRLDWPETFREPIESCLPCVIRTSVDRVNGSMGLMMDEERIVAMQINLERCELEILNFT